MRLRTKIVLVSGLMLTIAAALFGIATFRAQEHALLHGIDEKLLTTARLAREILPANYHDKISGADSVSETEYLRIVDRWNRLCKQMGLEYIWSLMLIDGKIVFTSGSSTSKDVNQGDHARFFETHSNPELYKAAFATMEPQYQINDDKWGRIKVVLLPFKDVRGRPYLFGASMKTTEVDALMRKMIRQSLVITVGVLIFGFFLSVLLASSLARPLEKLTDLARSITKGNWGQVVETSGAIEIRSLAHSINEMSRSAQEKITERKRVEEALRESENKFRSFADNSLVGIYLIQEGVFKYVNPKFAEIFGYTVEKCLDNMLFGDIVYPEDYAAVKEQVRKRLSGEIQSAHYVCRGIKNTGEIIQIEIYGSSIMTNGRPAVSGTILDITERKRTEDAMEKRLVALTRPLDQPEGIAFEELFDLVTIQRIQDEFAAATGVASIITHPDGTPITRPSNFCRLCESIIRCTETGRLNCYRSDALIGRHNPDGPIIQPCLSGGLWDAGASISVDNRHIANWLIGQVRDETQSEEKMLEYARTIGADEAAVIEAFREVPTMSLVRFTQIAQALFTLANQLSTSAYQNVQQARFITESKRAEMALRESEDHYRRIFDLESDAIVVIDVETISHLDVNKAAEEMYGYTRQELLQLKSTDLSAEPEQTKSRVQQDDGYVHIPHRLHRKKDGAIFPVDITGRFFTLKGRRTLIVAMRDITDRMLAEKALQDLSSHQEALLSAIPDIIMEVDADKVYTWANQVGLDFFGKDVIGKEAAYYFEGEQDTYEVVDQLLSGVEDVIYVRSWQRRRDGQKCLLAWLCRVLKDSTGNVTGAISTARDITERMQAEEEKDALQAQLLQAQKMESVGRLAGGVAHDFNNMLSAIIGHAELAMVRCTSEPIHAHLKVIEDSAHRSADLTRQLLAFARKQTVAPKVLDINDTVAGMLKMLLRLIGEDIDVVWKPKAGLWQVKIDPSQVDQILANLCVNARDAIPGVGKVTIETENIAFDDAYCAVHPGFVCGEYVMLAVSDDGCGMSKEILDHLFEPFFTTKEMGKGTGLGLATVYGIVKQNEGFVNVYSEPDKGSTFKIYLPRFVGEAMAPTARSNAEAPKGRGETVLLVEDDSVILYVSQAMLEQLGYSVLMAGTPGEALLQAKTHAAEIQLLITDVVMPEMNGRDLSKLISDIKPGLKCLFISGYTANVIAHHGVLDEGVNFLQKPFSMKDLASKVRQALERE